MKINGSRNQASIFPSAHESVLSRFCFLFLFSFFFNTESIGYIPSPGDVFGGKKRTFIFFEVEPVCSSPAALACILLYIL